MKNSLVIIPCRKRNFYVNKLKDFFTENDMETIVISDDMDEGCVCYEDQEIIDAHFIGMEGILKSPNAWDKTFYHIMKNDLQYEFFHVVEDDVFCSRLSEFIRYFKTLEKYDDDLITQCIIKKEEREAWPLWKRFRGDKDDRLLCSFHPLARFSKKLLNKVFEFYRKNDYLYFHEIMLPVLSHKYNLKTCDVRKEPDIKKHIHFMKFSPYPTSKDIKSGLIVHPVKITRWINEKNQHLLFE